MVEELYTEDSLVERLGEGPDAVVRGGEAHRQAEKELLENLPPPDRRMTVTELSAFRDVLGVAFTIEGRWNGRGPLRRGPGCIILVLAQTTVRSRPEFTGTGAGPGPSQSEDRGPASPCHSQAFAPPTSPTRGAGHAPGDAGRRGPGRSHRRLGGTWLSSHPMAAVRQLIRAPRRNICALSLTGTLDVDLLIGSGVADRVIFCFVSLGPFGLAPRFRQALEDETVEAEEHTGHGLTVALEAASRGLDFMPFYGPIGTALADRYLTIPSPVTGRPVQVARALEPDAAIVHAAAATSDGHTLLAGTIGVDVIVARAARRTIVTAERIVDRLPRSGARYLSRAEVHHVIEAPWGAHPLAHIPDYGMDWRALPAYARTAATADGFADWLATDLGETEQARRTRMGHHRMRQLRRAGAGEARQGGPGPA